MDFRKPKNSRAGEGEALGHNVSDTRQRSSKTMPFGHAVCRDVPRQPQVGPLSTPGRIQLILGITKHLLSIITNS